MSNSHLTTALTTSHSSLTRLATTTSKKSRMMTWEKTCLPTRNNLWTRAWTKVSVITASLLILTLRWEISIWKWTQAIRATSAVSTAAVINLTIHSLLLDKDKASKYWANLVRIVLSMNKIAREVAQAVSANSTANLSKKMAFLTPWILWNRQRV